MLCCEVLGNLGDHGFAAGLGDFDVDHVDIDWHEAFKKLHRKTSEQGREVGIHLGDWVLSRGLSDGDVLGVVDGILYQLIDIINSVRNYIRIEGSTDDIPIHSARYTDNWDLAADRAANVARVMMAEGVDPKRISVISYAEYRPVAPNDSEENRQLNRRVDVVFLNSELDVYEPGNSSEPTPTLTPSPTP